MKNCCDCFYCRVKRGDVRCDKGNWDATKNNVPIKGYQIIKEEINSTGKHFYTRMKRKPWARKKAMECAEYEIVNTAEDVVQAYNQFVGK